MRRQQYGGVCHARVVAWPSPHPTTPTAVLYRTFLRGSKTRLSVCFGNGLASVRPPRSNHSRSHELDPVRQAHLTPPCGSHEREHLPQGGRQGQIWRLRSLRQSRSRLQCSRQDCRIVLASCSISKGVPLYSQDSHTGSNEAVISNFHISSETRAKSALPLSPVDRMGDTEYAG